MFLEVLLRRARSDECKLFLQGIRTGKHSGIVLDFSINSIFVILNDADEHRLLRWFLLTLVNHEGLDIVRTHPVDMARAIQTSEKHDLTLEDALLYRKAQRENVDAIISLDSDFDGLDIPRRTPDEALQQA